MTLQELINKLKELQDTLDTDCEIRLITASDYGGYHSEELLGVDIARNTDREFIVELSAGW